MTAQSNETVAVIGLGYVGLPVALAMAHKFPTIGFDVKQRRVEELSAGRDSTNEAELGDLARTRVKFTTDPAEIESASFVIVAVPTPIDDGHRPDLTPLIRASETVGSHLKPGAVVVYESTVYPGVTEDICGPILEQRSGLVAGRDFFLGYSPERINPGDREHTFTRILKVVSADTPAALERVVAVYGAVVEAGVYPAASIKVAEAAKVIENTQRDLNIALMNELALIFDRIGIRTLDVIEAAATKWNFLRFTPGLVGGHCIGVDPYYLTTKAQELGYDPRVILAGRGINNEIGGYVAQRTIKMLSRCSVPLSGARVAILGLTFKENVPDLRNSRVCDIISELTQYGVTPLIHDPMGDPEEAFEEYGVTLRPWDEITAVDALILAVPHRFYLDLPQAELLARVNQGGVVVDVKSALDHTDIPHGMSYWSL